MGSIPIPLIQSVISPAYLAAIFESLIQVNMRLFGSPIKIQRIQYECKYANWYFENEFYFEEFLNLTREYLMVDEYTWQFQELHEICELEENERHDLARYVHGLRPDILENMTYCKTSQKAYLEAIRVEHMLKKVS